MTTIVCLDDRGGMLFNNRRQSRDSAVLEDIRTQIPGPLMIDVFSEKLIQGAGIDYVLAPEELGDQPGETWFFTEVRGAEKLLPLTEKLVIYRWNRHYPADVRWTADPVEAGFTLAERLDFSGSSHKIITREVYVR